MKTLVSAKAKRFNPWLIAGHAAWIIPATLLAVWYVYGMFVTINIAHDAASGWQNLSAIYAITASVILVAGLVLGVVIFFVEGYHRDVYNWWRSKVENYGKIED